MKTRALVIIVGSILAFSLMLIVFWQILPNQDNYSILVTVMGVSTIFLALAFSMLFGRNELVVRDWNNRSEHDEIPYRGVEMKRMYPISWRRGSHINMFEFINDNKAGIRKSRWREKRELTVNEPIQKAHSRACPRCGGSAGHACPCKYRSKY